METTQNNDQALGIDQNFIVPARKTLIGTILATEEFEYTNSEGEVTSADSILLRAESGEAFEVNSSKGMIGNIGIEERVWLTYEIREAGKTGYRLNGSLKLHKSSGNSALGIRKF